MQRIDKPYRDGSSNPDITSDKWFKTSYMREITCAFVEAVTMAVTMATKGWRNSDSSDVCDRRQMAVESEEQSTHAPWGSEVSSEIARNHNFKIHQRYYNYYEFIKSHYY